METSEIIVAIIVAIVFQYAIIYYAVANAHEKERQHLRIQTQLLIRMARKAGVDENEIQESLNA